MGAVALFGPGLLSAPAAAQHMDHMAMQPPPAAPAPALPAPTPMPMPAASSHASAQGASDGMMGDHAGPGADAAMAPGMAMTMGMGGAAYSSGSGTARLPRAEGTMRGQMIHAGQWMLMAHGYAWGVVTDQGGPRGQDMAFATSMAMLMADRDLSDRVHLQLKGMASLDPYMGQRGYPNLLATGEEAHGQPLVDRQHPHDLFMELAARVDYRLGDSSLFIYGGPVGEPALGPSAFMHRGSARYLPLAPITHHWFDSTHIAYGVVTAGFAAPTFQVETSAFRGREPDETRWNIERPGLDSWSVRGTWTPSPHWAVQASHGNLKTPEAQHPDEDEARTIASIQYATGGLTTTVAWSRKDRRPGRALSALLAEAAWEIGPHHAIFARVENVANDELFPDEADPLHDRPFRVTKAEGGYAYRLPLVGPLGVALGGTVAAYAKPAALDRVYGDAPVSWTLFAKVALGL
jgi:hypothetical protein